MNWRQLLRNFKWKLESLVEGRGDRYMTKVLISTNIGVFIAWRFLDQRFMWRHFIMNEFNTIRERRYYTIFTSAFSHIEPIHLMLNCLGIWFFGPHIEFTLGSLALLNLYFLGALGGFMGIWWEFKRRYHGAMIPNHLGASASTTALFMYFAVGNPWATVYVFIFPVPAILLAIPIFFLGVGGRQSNFSHSGHLGGGVMGALYYFVRRGFFKF